MQFELEVTPALTPGVMKEEPAKLREEEENALFHPLRIVIFLIRKRGRVLSIHISAEKSKEGVVILSVSEVDASHAM